MGIIDKLFRKKKSDVEKIDRNIINAFGTNPEKFGKLNIDENIGEEFDDAFKNAFGNKNDEGTLNFTPTGKFGYETTNPIMTTGIAQEYLYLNQLECENGDEITYNRIGSFSSGIDELPHPMDGYTIINSRTNKEVATLYIYAYSHGNSIESPEGFRFK